MRVTACTLALSPYFVTRFTEGFSQFVTSLTAPVASGWSIWPGGICTHWKSAALARRTPEAVFSRRTPNFHMAVVGDDFAMAAMTG